MMEQVSHDARETYLRQLTILTSLSKSARDEQENSEEAIRQEIKDQTLSWINSRGDSEEYYLRIKADADLESARAMSKAGMDARVEAIEAESELRMELMREESQYKMELMKSESEARIEGIKIVEKTNENTGGSRKRTRTGGA